MEYRSTFSQLLPVSSTSKDDSTEGIEMKTEAGQEAYSKYPVCAAIRKGVHGWKAGLTIGITADTIVVIVLLVFTLTSAFAFARDGSQVTLIDGSCSKTKSYSIWLHLLINILSTILLASSSYAMQCVISPTKTDLKSAHSEGIYLTIGAPSLRNLFRIGRYRALICCIALISSLPIHLLANSIIFSTLATDSYIMAVAYEQFIEIPPESLNTGYSYRLRSFNSVRNSQGGYQAPDGSVNSGGNPSEDVSVDVNLGQTLKDMLPNMTRIDNAECIRIYSQHLVAGWRHVVPVTEATPPNGTNAANFNFLATPYYQSVDICPKCQTYLNYTDPTIWTCAFTDVRKNNLPSRGCDSSKALSRADDFTISKMPISYCLAEPVPQRCQLQADIGISSVLLVVTVIKICVLVAVFVRLPDDAIATLGDAIACFLKNPDPQTRGCCLLDRRDVLHCEKRRNKNKKKKNTLPYCSLSPRWKPGSPFHKYWSTSSLANKWNAGPRGRQWAWVLLLLLAIVIICSAFLGTGINRIKQNSGLEGIDLSGDQAPPSDAAALWRMGFGTVNVNFLLDLSGISSSGGLIRRVLLVNTPQLLLSVFYFAYNSVWTQMMLAREWAQFGRKRQGLRVSGQVMGQQRSNYFLTIPYQAAVPLQLASALLHWLLSQSFFLARVNVYSGQPFVNHPPSVINTVGYSLMALIFLIALWGMMLIAIMVAGLVGRLKSPMPIVGGNSLAISAACHPPPGNPGIETKELMWGIVPEMETDDGIKHCSFSAGDVYSPGDLPVVDAVLGFKATEVLFG